MKLLMLAPLAWMLLACFLLREAAAAHPFLCCDYNGGKVAVVSADGKIQWEYQCKNPQDCWRLASGNYLFCFMSGAVEVTPAKQIVWEYKSCLKRSKFRRVSRCRTAACSSSSAARAA